MIDVSPFGIIFISSFLACAYFHIINYKELIELYEKFWNKKLLFMQLNLIVALMWVATYYSIYFSSATLFVYEFFIVGGCLSILFPNRNIGSKRFGIIFFTFLIGLPLYIYAPYKIGIILGIFAGLCGFLYNITSKKVASSLKLSASQTLAIRFWFLIVLSYCWMPTQFIQQLTLSSILSIIVISFLSLVLQVWLNQKSVIVIGGSESSLVASLAPTLTFFMQGFFFQHWYFPLLLLSLFGSVYIARILLSNVKEEFSQVGKSSLVTHN